MKTSRYLLITSCLNISNGSRFFITKTRHCCCGKFKSISVHIIFVYLNWHASRLTCFDTKKIGTERFQFPSCLMVSTKVPYCNSHQQIRMVTVDNAYLLQYLTLKTYMCNITSFGESKHFGFAFIDPPHSLSWHHFSFKSIPN